MPTTTDRSAYFPAIEQKSGQPLAYWFEVMTQIADRSTVNKKTIRVPVDWTPDVSLLDDMAAARIARFEES